MYERFTDRVRKVMQLANQRARRFNHAYLGTEHILLGLCLEGLGVAANVLKNLDIDLKKLCLEIEKDMQAGPEMVVIMGRLPQTPQVKKVIENAMEEARSLGQEYIGTEHLLLGLLSDEDGVVGLLREMGATVDKVRQEVMSLLGDGDDTLIKIIVSARVKRKLDKAKLCFGIDSDEGMIKLLLGIADLNFVLEAWPIFRQDYNQ